MGILDWLFGGSSTVQAPTTVSPLSSRWESTENGNPSTIYRNRRITVFEQDRGWKFCVAKIEGDDNPYFSEVYETADAAKYEAFAYFGGQPSTYQTRSEISRKSRADVSVGYIAETERLYRDLTAKLVDPELTVTELRKIERKVEGQVKRASWQLTQYYRDGVRRSAIDTAERLEPLFEALSADVAQRIEEAKARPRRRKPAPTDTTE
ncbi:hypothetical protein [Rhizobium laguerreae]|uniref:Uncharacterized protein n=1 Tax=Rhizobium laguerreae TaxID=1076926 RepID=A0A7Y2RBW9_9HYPH|nr:hypothetical protein [Rhizobium laguerreae]NNH67991.1 hypothetical protein [Rhizobium laguerreae]